MTRFIQLHALTVYPPSNLNRDDSGRPKTAKFGGVERLRISSQALKRAIRTSDVVQRKLAGHLGQRTARAGDLFLVELKKQGVDDGKALAIAQTMTAIFGTLDKEKADQGVMNKELFFLSAAEQLAIGTMCQDIAADSTLLSELASAAGEVESDEGEEDDDEAPKKKSKKKGISKKKLAELREKVLVTNSTAADIAMFGRMVAGSKTHNWEAAVQVAHAITTHKIEVEDDFYVAVDELQKREDAGAGFIGELGFGSGVFYLYACIDRDLLERNLGGNKALADTALAAFIEGFTTASPTGKQASFASRARASYLRVEKGPQQPRNLAAAFFKPVIGEDLLHRSIALIEDSKSGIAKQMNDAYGPCFDTAKSMQFIPGAADNQGSLSNLITFALEA